MNRHLGRSRISAMLVLSWLVSLSPVYADVHPEVQAALDWEFPPQNCKLEQVRRSADVTTQQRLAKKAAKKLKRCFANYEKNLKKEQDRLMSVAGHGLTESQAATIAGHLNKIRWVLEQGAAAVAEAQEVGGPDSKVGEHDFLDPNS